ncbi:MAG TPA: hypothetical protein VGL81_31750 [Polyangiaceae bacterium]|jgi:hypothetical protein
MSHATLWAGLERQIHAPAATALFQSTRTRHRALGGYESLHAAVDARRASSEAEGDAVLTVLLVEYARSRHPVWAAALAVSMRGALGALAQKIERGAESDSTSIVLLAFLEVAARFHTSHRRLGLRLYSETRRRVVRSAVGECRRHAQRSPDDVDSIVPDDPAPREFEIVLDRVRFARSLASKDPLRGESVAEYVARLRARGRRPRVRELPGDLAHHRRRNLDELRDALARVE